MTSLLRQIVAGPRAKHQETGLDLCYVTSNIIATSGPSQTYPQRAYRNPLDQLVAFLDGKHGSNWAIWEFRAEGTGYPDEAVYHRIRHYPWPDHHPPPFRLVPMIMASMRNWLSGASLDGRIMSSDNGDLAQAGKDGDAKMKKHTDRVVVVHCKAGKGRSGTMACSYLIAECGWRPEDALARFTERRMRPRFGAGVSIPSQLRWVSYVDRWTKGGKTYLDREIEVVEVHVSGLRHGVKVSIQGFVEDGKKIRVFHQFKRDERYVVEGDAPGSSGLVDFVSDMAGYAVSPPAEDQHGEVQEDRSYDEIVNTTGAESGSSGKGDLLSKVANSKPVRSTSRKVRKAKEGGLMDRLSPSRSSSTRSVDKFPAKGTRSAILAHSESPSSSATSLPAAKQPGNTSPSQSQSSLLAHRTASPYPSDNPEPGGQAVIFKPAQPVRLPTSDINVSLERRNRAPASMGLTMVTAVAHVWFNAFFEGNGPEQDGRPNDSGVFAIHWDAMDGIKGSSQKGTRAADRIAIVWRAVQVAGSGDRQHATGPRQGAESAGDAPGNEDGQAPAGAAVGITITEPGVGSPVPQMEPADWKGGNRADPEGEKRLGLRSEDPNSAGVSKASSIKSQEVESGDEGKRVDGDGADDESLKGVKVSGPLGEEELAEPGSNASEGEGGAGPAHDSIEDAWASDQMADKTADATAQKGFIIE